MPIADWYIICGVASWQKSIWTSQCPKLCFLHPPTIPPRVLWDIFCGPSHQLHHFDTSADGKALHADQADAARLSPEQRKDLQRRLAEWTEAHNQTEQKAQMKQQGIPLAFNMKVSLMWRMTLSITVGQHFHLTRPQNHLHGHTAPFARNDLK